VLKPYRIESDLPRNSNLRNSSLTNSSYRQFRGSQLKSFVNPNTANSMLSERNHTRLGSGVRRSSIGPQLLGKNQDNVKRPPLARKNQFMSKNSSNSNLLKLELSPDSPTSPGRRSKKSYISKSVMFPSSFTSKLKSERHKFPKMSVNSKGKSKWDKGLLDPMAKNTSKASQKSESLGPSPVTKKSFLMDISSPNNVFSAKMS